MQDWIGRKLRNRYELKGLVGEGGMGVVFRAFDHRLRRTVALKVIKGGLGNKEAKAWFRREALTSSRLNHPHIVTIHEIDEDQGMEFIVMEYVEGKSVKERLEEGTFPVEQALRIARQVADALKEAHDAQIIHRDLKPGNLLLSKRGRVKICDFGLAKLVDRTTASASGFKGTVLYSSPEQIKSQPLDRRTDIFSFGITLYELLTGQRPFTGDTFYAATNAVLNDNPTPPRQLRAEIPAEVEALVLRALEKDPANRYLDMGEVVAELDRLEEMFREARSAAARARRVEPAGSRKTKLFGAQSTAGPRLVRLLEGKEAEIYPLKHRETVVGREKGTLVFSDDPLLSASHAAFCLQGDAESSSSEGCKWVLKDLNSTNGVFVRIREEQALEDGDQFVIGRQRFVFTDH
ncbi:MAG: protein kinase [Terriglobia bacterium]